MMDGGRSNYSGQGRGRGRGGDRRSYGDAQNQGGGGGGRGRGDAQNQGGGGGGRGRGGDAQNRGGGGGGRGRGSYNQPPSQWVSRPPANPAWGVRPPPQGAAPPPQQQQQAVGAGSSSGGNTWTGRPWAPSSSSAPVQPPPASLVTSVQSLTISEKSSSSTPTPTPSSSTPKEGQIQAIKRPDHGTLAVRKINIIVNHFPVSFDKQGVIYHYDVDVNAVAADGSPIPKRKPLRKSDMRFIRDEAFKSNMDLLKSVYDGEKNIYSAVRLNEGKMRVEVMEGEDVRSGLYMFTIKLVNELKLSKLHEYLRGSLPGVPRDTLQGLDLVMKENPTRRTISLGSRSFFPARNPTDLYGGIEALRGYQPSLKPTGQGLALCLDYSVLSFRKPLPVFDYLKEHLYGFKGVNDVIRMKRDINQALKGLKVRVTHRRTNQKYTIVGLTDLIARDIYFDLVDREGNTPPQRTNLVAYFREKWGKEIRNQGIPCLDVGTPKKPNVVPIEFCVLVEGQRFPKEDLDKDTAVFLKNLTLVKPWERSKAICDMVRADDGPYGEVASNFGLVLDMNMTRVEGRVIGAPELKLGGARPVKVDPAKCHWNLLGKSFVESKSIERWALLDFADNRNGLQTEAFVDHLRARCRNLGIQMAPPLVYRLAQMRDLASVDRIERLLQDVMNESNKQTKGKLQLIICGMTKRDPGYKNLKWVSETKVGVITQCVLSSNANKLQDQYLANVCLKINAKLGGMNFEVSGKLLNFGDAEHVMFIGADVNHPAPMNKECPSIAAVVGTVNWPAANRYAARVSPQTHRCETIKNFGEMCSHLITAYAQTNKVRPRRIVVFRDGVSEGQFEMVLGQELLDLKKTIYTNDYKPPITVIVAQKRHQTRLFPENRNDGGQTGNVPPGTVVDTKIVHPHDFDFYLCSHYGGIGTSKPTHYYVLWDENGFNSDRLQKLIYDMCYTFVRCTKPVSLVPPVYYADLVAYRGRMFQEVAMETTDRRSVSSSSSSTPSFDPSFYSLHRDLENAMFFV